MFVRSLRGEIIRYFVVNGKKWSSLRNYLRQREMLCHLTCIRERGAKGLHLILCWLSVGVIVVVGCCYFDTGICVYIDFAIS